MPTRGKILRIFPLFLACNRQIWALGLVHLELEPNQQLSNLELVDNLVQFLDNWVLWEQFLDNLLLLEHFLVNLVVLEQLVANVLVELVVQFQLPTILDNLDYLEGSPFKSKWSQLGSLGSTKKLLEKSHRCPP